MLKISVILPVYNVAKYLEECLDSLINQTLKDIEIICVDDKSTDNSLQILKEYAEKDSRIRVIEFEINKGQGIARNYGIDIAQGDYISFVDPDDWIEPNALEELYNQAKALNSEVVIFPYKRVNNITGKITTPPIFREAVNSHEYIPYEVQAGINLERELFLKNLMVFPCFPFNKIYLRKLDNNIYFPNLRCYEDVEFVVKALLNAKRVSFKNFAYYNYRIRKSSLINSENNKNLILFYDAYCNIKNYMISLNLYDKFALNLKYFLVVHVRDNYQRLTKKDKKLIIEEIKHLLSKDDFEYIKKVLKIGKRKDLKKVLKNIFSVQNTQDKKHKQLRILGIKLNIKRKKNNVQTV